MISRRLAGFAIAVSPVTLLAVCSSGCAPPAQPTAVPTFTPPIVGGGLPPIPALRAQEVVAEELGVPPEELAIIETEQEEWPNSCLGLQDPDEFCAEVITPGWRVILERDGQRYEARTDQEGGVVRWQRQ